MSAFKQGPVTPETLWINVWEIKVVWVWVWYGVVWCGWGVMWCGVVWCGWGVMCCGVGVGVVWCGVVAWQRKEHMLTFYFF